MISFLKTKWLSLRITAKVGLILVILVLACLIVAGSAFLQNSRTTEKLQNVANTLLPATRLSQHALTTFTEELKLYEDAIVTDEELLLYKGKEKEQDLEQVLEQLDSITTGMAEQDFTTVSGLRNDIVLYADQAVQVYARMIQSVDETGNEELYDQAILLGQQAIALQARLDTLNRGLQKLLDKHLSDVSLFTERQQRLGVFLTLLTIVMALLISFLLTRLITRPIIALAAIAQKISRGQWSGELVPAGNDEVAELTRSFRNMLRVLHQREEDLIQSEKKYREIFNATKEAIIIYDAITMKVIDANHTCRKFIGYPLDKMQNMKFGDMSEGAMPYDLELAQAFFKKTREGIPQIFEWPVHQKNGEVAWAELSLTLSEIDQQQVIILVARDISERKKNEAEKQELAKQLQQADKRETLGTLAGGIAHDFNNILSGILGYTELAALRPDIGEAAKSDLENVKKAAFRARDLVSQILTFSRKSDKEITVFEPSIIVKEVAKLLRSSVPSTIEIHQKISTHAKLQADPTQFHQIVMNLCTNAVHAMEETGGKLDVVLKEISTEDQNEIDFPDALTPGRYICFEVKDTGIGMDTYTREKIFDPYFTTKGVGKGTGLGLSVVHGIVTEYGGQVELNSTPGKGTTFRIYLPSVELESERKFTVEQQAFIEDNSQPKPTGERIMLVDDETDLIKLLADFFIQAGYQICAYSDSEKALEDFSNSPDTYDMVITDMTMPGLTGLDLSQNIHAQRPDIPVILMTGYSKQVNRDKALSQGINDFFLKPPDMQQLLLTVAAILAKK